MLVRLWDVNKHEWDLIQVEVPGKPNPGPCDDYLEVEGFEVEPDENGNFIRRNYSEEELDAVHAFAVARLSIDLWEKALNKKVVWPWTNKLPKQKLKIVLYSGLLDAAFRLQAQSILFGTTDLDSTFTCRSIDIVAHETTHALVESYRPGIHWNGSLDVIAVIEALADLTPIFLLASIPQLFTKALNVTSNDLHQISFLSEFAEGYAENGSGGIRSALKPDLSNPNNPCSLGSPIVTAGYETIIRTWEAAKDYADFNSSTKKSFSILLHKFANSTKTSPEIYLKKLDIISMVKGN